MQVFDGNEEQLVPLILQSLFSLISLPNLIAVGLVGMGTDYWLQKFSQKIFTKKHSTYYTFQTYELFIVK
jgi:hypothetical protein